MRVALNSLKKGGTRCIELNDVETYIKQTSCSVNVIYGKSNIQGG